MPISVCHSPIPLLGSAPVEEPSQTSQTSVILSLWALRHLPSEAKPGPQLLQPPSTSITLSTSENQTSPQCCRHAKKAYVCFPALDWEGGFLERPPSVATCPAQRQRVARSIYQVSEWHCSTVSLLCNWLRVITWINTDKFLTTAQRQGLITL